MKNIYLVGFMGTGKTETAKLLARRLGRTFADTDDLIEEKERMSIPEIFELKGEPYFRKVEHDVVADFAKKEGFVVACGGGAFVAFENIRLMKESGIVVCLESTPEVILKRTKRFAHRPLLNVEDPLNRIRELLATRAPFYAQAHYRVDCDALTVEETAEEVLKCLNSSPKSSKRS